MYLSTAAATRTCVCGTKILKGEEHFARPGKRSWRWPCARKNYCMLCALADSSCNEYATKYLAEHRDVHNRLLLKRIQLGVAFK